MHFILSKGAKGSGTAIGGVTPGGYRKVAQGVYVKEGAEQAGKVGRLSNMHNDALAYLLEGGDPAELPVDVRGDLAHRGLFSKWKLTAEGEKRAKDFQAKQRDRKAKHHGYQVLQDLGDASAAEMQAMLTNMERRHAEAHGKDAKRAQDAHKRTRAMRVLIELAKVKAKIKAQDLGPFQKRQRLAAAEEYAAKQLQAVPRAKYAAPPEVPEPTEPVVTKFTVGPEKEAEPSIPTDEEILATEITIKPKTYELDWGPRDKRQGRRTGGGMVVGAMSAGPVGVKTYTNKFKNLPDYESNKKEMEALEGFQIPNYLKARSAGLGHEDAMLFVYRQDEKRYGPAAESSEKEAEPGWERMPEDAKVFKAREPGFYAGAPTGTIIQTDKRQWAVKREDGGWQAFNQYGETKGSLKPAQLEGKPTQVHNQVLSTGATPAADAPGGEERPSNYVSTGTVGTLVPHPEKGWAEPWIDWGKGRYSSDVNEADFLIDFPGAKAIEWSPDREGNAAEYLEGMLAHRAAQVWLKRRSMDPKRPEWERRHMERQAGWHEDQAKQYEGASGGKRTEAEIQRALEHYRKRDQPDLVLPEGAQRTVDPITKRPTVHSEQFKSWFGDWAAGEGSKVVKPSGEPQEEYNISPVTVYHGTATGGFRAFRKDKTKPSIFGRGFYFTEDQGVATEYTEKGLGKAWMDVRHFERNGEFVDTMPKAMFLGMFTDWEKGTSFQMKKDWEQLNKWADAATVGEDVNLPEVVAQAQAGSHAGMAVGTIISRVEDTLGVEAVAPPSEVFQVYLAIKNPIDMDTPMPREAFDSYARWTAEKELQRERQQLANYEAQAKAGREEEAKSLKAASEADAEGEAGAARHHRQMAEIHREDHERNARYAEEAKALVSGMERELKGGKVPAIHGLYMDDILGVSEHKLVTGKDYADPHTYEDFLTIKRALLPRKAQAYVGGDWIKTDKPLAPILHIGGDENTLTWGDVHWLMTNRHKGGQDTFTKWAQAQGYDGIAHTGGWNIGTREHRVWIAFEPNQIKATDARRFDPSSDDIFNGDELPEPGQDVIDGQVVGEQEKRAQEMMPPGWERMPDVESIKLGMLRAAPKGTMFEWQGADNYWSVVKLADGRWWVARDDQDVGTWEDTELAHKGKTATQVATRPMPEDATPAQLAEVNLDPDGMLHKPEAPEDPAAWHTGDASELGPGNFAPMVRHRSDPKRSPREDRKGQSMAWRGKLDPSTEPEWREKIAEHMADGEPRTFNRIAVELGDYTADVAWGKAPGLAVLKLIEQGELEYTKTSPMLFRRVAKKPDLVLPEDAAKPERSKWAGKDWKVELADNGTTTHIAPNGYRVTDSGSRERYSAPYTVVDPNGVELRSYGRISDAIRNAEQPAQGVADATKAKAQMSLFGGTAPAPKPKAEPEQPDLVLPEEKAGQSKAKLLAQFGDLVAEHGRKDTPVARRKEIGEETSRIRRELFKLGVADADKALRLRDTAALSDADRDKEAAALRKEYGQIQDRRLKLADAAQRGGSKAMRGTRAAERERMDDRVAEIRERLEALGRTLDEPAPAPEPGPVEPQDWAQNRKEQLVSPSGRVKIQANPRYGTWTVIHEDGPDTYNTRDKAFEEARSLEYPETASPAAPRPRMTPRELAESKLEALPAGHGLVTVSMDDIPWDTAARAYDGTSWTPEDRAARQRWDYVQHIRGLEDSLRKYATTPEKKAEVRAELEDYRKGYRDKLVSYLGSRHGLVSSFIAGPAKFPARRMNKKSDSVDRRLNEMMDWSAKARRGMVKRLSGVAPVTAADPDAQGKLRQQLAEAEALQAKMKAANAIVRKKSLTDDQKVAELAKLKISERIARELLKPDFAGRKGFAGYQLTNNNATIKRLKDRIQDVATEQSTPTREVTFDGGTVTDNAEDNRVQIFFDDKPDDAMRQKLKSRGFRWAPSVGAWQRQRTAAARMAVAEVLGVDMKGSGTAKSMRPAADLDIQGWLSQNGASF